MKQHPVHIFFASCMLLATPMVARSQDAAAPVLAQSERADPAASAAQPVQTPGPPPAASNEVPPVEHTGLATLARDLYHDFASFPRRQSTWVILGVGGGLAALARPIDTDVNARLASSSKADKLWKPGHIIGGPVMYAVPLALYFGGRYVLPKFDNDESQTNKWSHVGLDLLRAELLEEGIVQGLKFTVRRTRPNGQNYSFPSGHAAATFALAAVLERHLGYRLSWPTLAIATYVATSRLHDNVHYLSDVVFGAAVGTAAGWTVVGRHGRTNYAFEPMPVPGGFAFVVTRRARAD